jgi:hypothetical protein
MCITANQCSGEQCLPMQLMKASDSASRCQTGSFFPQSQQCAAEVAVEVPFRAWLIH